MEKSCPPDATGEYPGCICKDFSFIFVDDACVKVNRDECPPPAIKINDKQGCSCPDKSDFFDDYYWLCRTKLYLPNITTTLPPPTRTTSSPRPRCQAYYRGEWPDCTPIPCRDHPDKFEPNCPFIIVPTLEPRPTCPPGQIGVYPSCQPPCEPHTARKYIQ